MILQKGVFSEDKFQDTEKIIRTYFSDVQIVSDIQITLNELPPFNCHTPFRGAMTLAARMNRSYTFADATKWAPAFRKEILSSDYKFLDAANINDNFPVGPNFVRPTAGNKSFSGNIYTAYTFHNEYQFLTINKNEDPFTLCMISTKKIIHKEWRTIFIDGEYCSGSQYMQDGNLNVSSIVPTDVVAYAVKLSKDPYFQNIFEFVIDIAETYNGYKMLEVNGFETASFYDADLDKIYQTWSQIF